MECEQVDVAQFGYRLDHAGESEETATGRRPGPILGHEKDSHSRVISTAPSICSCASACGGPAMSGVWSLEGDQLCHLGVVHADGEFVESGLDGIGGELGVAVELGTVTGHHLVAEDLLDPGDRDIGSPHVPLAAAERSQIQKKVDG